MISPLLSTCSYCPTTALPEVAVRPFGGRKMASLHDTQRPIDRDGDTLSELARRVLGRESASSRSARQIAPGLSTPDLTPHRPRNADSRGGTRLVDVSGADGTGRPRYLGDGDAQTKFFASPGVIRPAQRRRIIRHGTYRVGNEATAGAKFPSALRKPPARYRDLYEAKPRSLGTARKLAGTGHDPVVH